MPIDILDALSLRGFTAEQVEAAIPDDWQRALARKGDGVVFRRPGHLGDQIRIMAGNPNRSSIEKQGPYVIVSVNGVKSPAIPLAGNKVLL